MGDTLKKSHGKGLQMKPMCLRCSRPCGISCTYCISCNDILKKESLQRIAEWQKEIRLKRQKERDARAEQERIAEKQRIEQENVLKSTMLLEFQTHPEMFIQRFADLFKSVKVLTEKCSSLESELVKMRDGSKLDIENCNTIEEMDPYDSS